MRHCGKCQTDKHLSDFNRKRSSYQPICRSCQSEYARKHYAENKAYYIAKSAKQKRAVVGLISDAKDRPCADCGMRYPSYVMDFDHIEDNKSFNVSTMRFGVSRHRLQVEIEKCDVVCANCHRMRTFKRASAPGVSAVI